MKRGFTLLELMVVIIIVGVLATLGVTQYQATIEKARGAEARSAISQLRTSCASLYMQDGNTAGCTEDALGIGVGSDRVPSACRATNFFRYGASGAADDAITLTATRCTTGGKTPSASSELTLELAVDFALGTDVWSGTGGY